MTTICIVLPAHWGAMKGGAECQADLFAEYIKQKTDFDVVYLARYVPSDNSEYGYTISPVPTVFKSERYGQFWDALSLHRKLVEINPDVVWQHVGCAYTGVCAYYCKKNNKTMFWQLASDIDVTDNQIPLSPKKIPRIIDHKILQYGIKNARYIIAQTSTQANLLLKNYNRRADYIIPNFHDLYHGDMVKDERMTIVWIANIKKLKQPELFIQLANEFIDNDKIIFKLIGRNENTEWCSGLLDTINSRKNIEYLGELSNEQVNEQLVKSHMLVNTSVYEGFPNTFIQGWLREVPTLSLNVDPDGVIQANNLGLFAKNLDNMKKFIAHMSIHEQELSDMGLRAREFAEQNYSMKNADKCIDIISDAIA